MFSASLFAVACGPSEEQKAACSDAKAAAASAWKAYADEIDEVVGPLAARLETNADAIGKLDKLSKDIANDISDPALKAKLQKQNEASTARLAASKKLANHSAEAVKAARAIATAFGESAKAGGEAALAGGNAVRAFEEAKDSFDSARDILERLPASIATAWLATTSVASKALEACEEVEK